MLQLVRDMKAGRAAGFTLDGPRGPARVAQAGAVWLASATGNPLLPFHLEASSHWSLRSWDRTQIPKPFSTVALVVGEPMGVPARGVAGDARAGQAGTRTAPQRTRIAAIAMLERRTIRTTRTREWLERLRAPRAR